MEDTSRKMDMEELMKYCNNLIDFLKDDKDIIGLQHFLRHSKALQSQCDDDFNEVLSSIEVTVNGIDDLELQRASVEEQRQTLKKSEQAELRAEMKLSMHASVTNVIPNLDDLSKISGHIVVKDKKIVDNFEFDPAKHSSFDTCNDIWKMIMLQ
ncbi:hypothetical protein F511_29455 [Dorcoceras hygrometricum]|uniref:Kinetochore protein Spc24 n=1 Tax=Dorcoceras hygrometricum TaxID=472368 RepID=A0A2Z7A6B0_9LAMI|nr:hypothetical protein F511_29455 [Dorcoceras hygrometricum]